jgi:catalase
MRGSDNAGATKNYEPNSFGGPVETREPLNAPLAGDGPSGTYEWDSREGDDFVQAGALYRVMDELARARLVANIAGSLAQVSKNEIIERSVAHFRAADAEYGERIATAVAQLRGE